MNEPNDLIEVPIGISQVASILIPHSIQQSVINSLRIHT